MQSESKPPKSESIQRELAAEARTELQQPQPDWLRVKELAERAAELSEGGGAAPVPVVRPDVEAARARAEATLAEVRPRVAEADDLRGEDNMARVCLEHAQQSYDRAVAAPSAEAAIDGFRVAVESANAAHDHAIGLRAGGRSKLPTTRKGNLLWGAFGRTKGD